IVLTNQRGNEILIDVSCVLTSGPMPIQSTTYCAGNVIRIRKGRPMQAEAALPSQSYVWTVLAPRLEAGLAEQKTRILDLCGLYDVFGPPGDGFTGELEANQTMIELTGLLVVAFAHDMVDRIASLRVGRKPG